MIDEKLITEFIPANVLEHHINTWPYARLNDKIRAALRRYLATGMFTSTELPENAPRLYIVNSYFDPQKMGYEVIARIL